MPISAFPGAFPTKGWADVLTAIDESLAADSGPTAIAIVDVDHFVALVEQLPPHLGRDAVLDAVGLRLAEHLDENDRSARIVDDLHVIIRTGLSGPAAMEGTGLRIVDSFRQPLSVGNHVADCTVSVGVAVSRHGDSAKDLFRFAQYALDDAKALGRNQMVAFADEDRDLLGSIA